MKHYFKDRVFSHTGTYYRRLLLFLPAFVISGISLFPAQRLQAAVLTGYHVTHWDSENDLPENWAKTLTRTGDGYVWIGTLSGLARFDGLHFTVFNKDNTPQMVDDAIGSLAEDAEDGSLWVATKRCVLHYEDYRLNVAYSSRQGLPSDGCVAAAVGGGVWFESSDHSLTLYQNGHTNRFSEPAAIVKKDVRYLRQVSPKSLLFTTELGLYQLRIDSKRFRRLGPPDPHIDCYWFATTKDGAVWLGTSRGLWRYQNRKWTHPIPQHGQGPTIAKVWEIRPGEFWYWVVNRGLYRWKKGHAQPLSIPGLEGVGITTIVRGADGNLWIGSGLGLYQLTPLALKVYSRLDGMRNDNTHAISVGPDGTIWVATDYGVTGIAHGHVKNLPWPKDESNGVFLVLATHENRLLSESLMFHLLEFQNGRWNYFSDHIIQKHNTGVSALYEDRQHRLWFGANQGVVCDDHGRTAFYSKTNGLSCGNVKVIFQDHNGEMWFGTYGGGIDHLHDGKITAYRTSRGLYNNRAWWIHEDKEGVFWIATQDGLNRFEHGRFFTFTTRQGLMEDTVNNVQEDDQGYLWLSGLKGIYRISRQQLNEVAKGQRRRVQCMSFGEADGMLTSECNGGDQQPGGCKDPQGRIWFVTPRGVVMIDPKKIAKTSKPPPVVIEQAIADDNIVYGDGYRGPVATPGSALRLKPGGARVLEFRYTANSFRSPRRIRFEYRLKGYDPKWRRDDENARVAYYTNLRPGPYTFQVRACNSQGVWNLAGASLSLYIEPFFYQTWPFIGGCLAAFGFLSFGFHSFRLRRQRGIERLERQVELERERARIAQDMHDDLGTSLSEIAIAGEVAQRGLESPEKVEATLNRISTLSRALVGQIGELVWAVNPQHDTLDSFLVYVRDYAGRLFADGPVTCHLRFPSNVPSLAVSSEFRRNLFLAVKEALNNVMKHAAATEVQLRVRLNEGWLAISVTDNGKGLSPGIVPEFANGLKNMRRRMAALNGTLDIEATNQGNGTTLHFQVPLESLRTRS